MQKTLRRYLSDALTPAARAWIRYAPLSAGKPWLWENFHWRARKFNCRTRHGSRITGNTEDLIQRHLYFFGTWEPNISNWLCAALRPGDCFVDIGANIGHYSLLASRLVGDSGQVVAVEAAQSIHRLLDGHVALNRRRNIRTVQAAAADLRGTVKLYPGGADNIGKTSMIAHDGPVLEVPALPLTDILKDNEIRRIRVIKIDVEGAELQVLRGLAPLLERLPRAAEIIMEISPDLMPDAQRARAEIFATLRAHDFRAYVFDNDYGVQTYLQAAPYKRPVALTESPPSRAQADVLFSRAPY